jgi:hypothetical protein
MTDGSISVRNAAITTQKETIYIGAETHHVHRVHMWQTLFSVVVCPWS